MDSRTREAVAHRHGEIFRLRYLTQVSPLPHATDLVEMLHAKGLKIVLASSAVKSEVAHYTDLLKIGGMLDGAVCGDDVRDSKPAGDIFAAALALVFPLGPQEAIAIGDTPYDVEAALRSGIRTIGVRSGGFSTETLSGAGAPWVYASVKELAENFAASPLAE